MTVPSPAPDVTVIICTRNRAPQLRKVLDSVVGLRVPPGLHWEFLVVDNGSSDDTDEVVRSYQDRLPVRVVREDLAGLSNARNRGVQEAAGRYICWTDDDVMLDPEWLAAYSEAFKRHPEAAVFGGRITPVLEPPTPAWFAQLTDDWPLTILLARREFGEAPIPLDFKKGIIPFGANFAVRTAEQRRVAYEPGLGVSPHHRRIGEEAEVIFRLLADGATGWWTPHAKVSHLITRQRQTWDYIEDFSAAYGETLAFLELTWPGRHHMTWAQHDLQRIDRRPARLAGSAFVYRTASRILRSLGRRRRAAELLAVAGLYSGAARFARKKG